MNKIIDQIIIKIVNNENESSDDNDDGNWYMKISHTNGLKALKNAIEYTEQEVIIEILYSFKEKKGRGRGTLL